MIVILYNRRRHRPAGDVVVNQDPEADPEADHERDHALDHALASQKRHRHLTVAIHTDLNYVVLSRSLIHLSR